MKNENEQKKITDILREIFKPIEIKQISTKNIEEYKIFYFDILVKVFSTSYMNLLNIKLSKINTTFDFSIDFFDIKDQQKLQILLIFRTKRK